MYMLLLLFIGWNIYVIIVCCIMSCCLCRLSCWLSKLLVVEFMHTKLKAYALELMLIKVEGLCPGAYA